MPRPLRKADSNSYDSEESMLLKELLEPVEGSRYLPNVWPYIVKVLLLTGHGPAQLDGTL
jgi:hypothetical protein